MKVKQFEIWIADLNHQMKTENRKIQPVIVVQTNLLNKVHPSTVVCPITTNVKPGSEILRVLLKKSTAGLKEDSDVMIDQIRAIDNKRLLKKLGEADPATANKIKENLKVILDLD